MKLRFAEAVCMTPLQDYYAEQELAKYLVWGIYQELDLHNTPIWRYRLTRICIAT